MRITFVLPAVPRVPMGGAKVVYAHAAGLARRGHRVTVVAPRRGGEGLRHRLFEGAVRLRDAWHGVGGGEYYRAEGVETRAVGVVDAGAVPDGDAVIATGWQTAPWVAALPRSKGVGCYFVQGEESYQSPRAARTWALGLHVFTCSGWLARAVQETGVSVLGVVPNAIDPEEFYLERPIPLREPSVVWLYHRAAVKGPRDGAEVLRRLRARLPEVRADVFSARPPSHSLPSWVTRWVRPQPHTLRRLYNRSAVVLHTGYREGWGLTPMEGAACGCAVAAYASEGLQEYLQAGESAALVPVGEVELLVEAAYRLLTDQGTRVKFAEAARAAVSRYSWEKSTGHLEELLRSAEETSPASRQPA